MPFTAFRPVALMLLLGFSTIGLSACSAQPLLPVPTESVTASESPSPTPSASETTEPDDEGTPVGIGCNELISPQAMYDYNPNFSLDDTYVPEADTPAERIEKMSGLSCSWVNQTSGETISVSVAKPSSATMARIRSDLKSVARAVTNFGAEGYFTAGDSPDADALSGPYWVNSSSTTYGEAADAQPIILAALSGLGQ